MDALILLFTLLVLITLAVFSFRWYVIGRKTIQLPPSVDDRDPALEAVRVREIRDRLSVYAGHPEHALEVRERLNELVAQPIPLELDDPIPYPEKDEGMEVNYIPPEQAEDLLWLFKRDPKDAPTAS